MALQTYARTQLSADEPTESERERTNSLIISSHIPAPPPRLLCWSELRHRGKSFPVFLMLVKLVQHYLQKFFHLKKWLHKNVMAGFHVYCLSVITMTNLLICQVERYLFVFRWQPCKPSLEFQKQAGASLAPVSPAAETPCSDHNQHFWWWCTSQNRFRALLTELSWICKAKIYGIPILV